MEIGRDDGLSTDFKNKRTMGSELSRDDRLIDFHHHGTVSRSLTLRVVERRIITRVRNDKAFSKRIRDVGEHNNIMNRVLRIIQNG